MILNTTIIGGVYHYNGKGNIELSTEVNRIFESTNCISHMQ